MLPEISRKGTKGPELAGIRGTFVVRDGTVAVGRWFLRIFLWPRNPVSRKRRPQEAETRFECRSRRRKDFNFTLHSLDRRHAVTLELLIERTTLLQFGSIGDQHGYRHCEVVQSATKGYGFIQPQGGGKDVFVHISAVERAGLTSLNEGQTVQYEIESNRGKESAINLKVK